MSGQEKHHHDPIHYLRAVRGDEVQSSDDLRRLDSDDEGNSDPHPAFASGIDIGLAATTLNEISNDKTLEEPPTSATTTTVPQPHPPASFPPKPEPRKAYRPQSIGVTTPQPPARARPDADEFWPYRETLSFTRSLVFYGAGSITKEHERACAHIQKARTMRQTYFGGKGTVLHNDNDQLKDLPNLSFRMGKEGVAEIYHTTNLDTNLIQVLNIEQFSADYNHLVELTSEGAMRSFCFQRLQILSTSFKMHTTLNSTVEMEEQSSLLGTDFYRIMKVDNHIHAAAAPSAKQFVQFVRDKLETEADTVVSTVKVKSKNAAGEEVEMEVGKSLAQVYEEAGLDMDHLTIDAFNVLADYSVYQRFDNFNSKYSPFRMADMRRIFLKTTNNNDGRYFAELLKIVLNRHEVSKGHNSACEMRLSIYGMERHEWYDLAKWMITDWKHPDFPGKMISSDNRWLVQVPRLWRIYSQKPVVDGQPQRSFLEMIENLFVPLFEATLDPDGHPEVAEAMKHIVGFDSVDDEGALEESCSCHRPHQWTSPRNPAYWWQLYFLWANLEVLNRLRQALGLNTFSFRPHAGETGTYSFASTTALEEFACSHTPSLTQPSLA
jgi:AMP deaminase